MKAIIVSSLLLSSTAFAQTLSVDGFKNLLSERKATIENVAAGMTKKVITKSVVETDSGSCKFMQAEEQTILKIEGSKMIVHSKESFAPAVSKECSDAGFEAYQETVIFYEDLPQLSDILKGVDESKDEIKSISRAGNIITMTSSDEEIGLITSKLDLTKSSFKNVISMEAQDFSMQTQDLANVDVNSIDLTKVLFCENVDGEFQNCVEGDFSDILF